ncbi:MAG: C39 family peptidase [Flexilinea sp.]|nr:C39 family peptidase [Flexilinea sp.]
MNGQKLFAIFILTVMMFSGCRPDRLPDPQVIIRTQALEPGIPENRADDGKGEHIFTATASATASPDAPSHTPSLTPEPSATPLVVTYDVPVISQEGLLLEGIPTGVGCVPACIEMMTFWWNSVDTRNPVLTAQEVIDRNAEQGLYVAGRGMSSASAADELAEIGYTHHMYLNSSKEELLSAFREHGPVGVLVKTNWVPTTMNHAAVLTGYDETTDTVTLNDPFYGSEVSWSWEAFDGIWGLNYAGDRDYSGDVVRRVFFEIYPE